MNDSLYLFPSDDNPPAKTCKGACGRTLLATVENFYRDNTRKDKLKSFCKECENSKKKQERKKKSVAPINIPEGHKICTGSCGRTLSATTEHFNRDKQKKDGLASQCRICRKAYYARPEVQKQTSDHMKAYYAQPEVREHTLIRMKNYHSQPEVRERNSARMKEYRNRPETQEHLKAYYGRSDVQGRKKAQRKSYYNRPEVQVHIREYRKSYHSRIETHELMRNYHRRPEVRERKRLSNHRRHTHIKGYLSRPEVQEHYKAYRKEYYARPEVREKASVHRHNRRARRKSVQGTYTPWQIQDQLKRQKHKCYYCHKKFQKVKGKCVYHIEHTFPLSRVAGTDIPANSIDYIVLSCPTCNLAKGKKFPWEFTEGGRLL